MDEDNIKDILSRVDYLILIILQELKATDSITGMTQKEISASGLPLKKTAMYKHLKILKELQYISECGKDGNSNLYYITDLGKQLLIKGD